MSDRPARSRIRVRAGKGPPPSVDGHPGWVRKSVKHYVAVCTLCVLTQSVLLGSGPILDNARSAAWWCVALGVFGGLLIWTPIWALMRGEHPKTLDESFSEAYGKIGGGILSGFYALLLFFDAVVALLAVASIAHHYLLPSSSEVVLSLASVGMLTLALFRHGLKGISLAIHRIILFVYLVLFVSSLYFLENSNINNLFPLLGNSVPLTLSQLPVALGGYVGVTALGLLPRETGSAKPVRFRTGLYALLLGGVGATALTFLVNLSVPPLAVPDYQAWGHQVMVSAEFTHHRSFRIVFIMLLLMSFILACGANIANGDQMLRGMLPKNARWPFIVLGGALALVALFINQAFSDKIELLMVYRLPLAAVPAWITLGVLAVKRKRKAVKSS